MASTYDYLRQQMTPLEIKIKSLLNNQLRSICKSENLQISGVKATLQNRVLSLLRDAVTSGDVARFNEIKQKISPGTENEQHSPIIPRQPASQSNNHYQSLPNSYRPASSSVNMPASQSAPNQLKFRQSPFYSFVEQLSRVEVLPVTNSTRHTSMIPIGLPTSTVERLRYHKNLRIMLYCTAEPAYGPNCDVAFPTQLEVRVNNEALQASLRGVKKKPGTTKPADITDFCRKFQGNVQHHNQVTITYAATEKRFYAVVNLERKYSVEELVERIRNAQVISKTTVLNEMITRAKDPDILATSTVMSLKCPLSFMRMKLPCRSSICNHNQCFDATSFLELQEQAPQWACPICSKVFGFGSLAIDQYVQEILASTSKSVEQVTIEPDGSWKQGAHAEEPVAPKTSSTTTTAVDSDDVVEVSDYRINDVKAASAYSTPQSFGKSPAVPSREASTQASSAPRSTGTKRKVEEVIDLTLSDDEAPIRPVKRQSTGSFHQPSGQKLGSGSFSQYAQMQANGNYYQLPQQPQQPQQPLQSPGLPPHSPVQMQPQPQYLYSPQSPPPGYHYNYGGWQ